jgi:O-antigen ligase
MFLPVMAMTIWTTAMALWRGEWSSAFWSAYGHYQIYLLLLCAITLGQGEWQARAIKALYFAGLLAATLLYLNQFSLLPEIKLFKSYLIYNGNKSILIGILLGLIAGYQLYELCNITRFRDQWWVWLGWAYLVMALLFLAKTRTGILIFMLLSFWVVIKHIKWSAHNILIMVLSGILLIGVGLSSSALKERVVQTVNGVKEFKGDTEQGDARLHLFQGTIAIVKEKPIFGHGIGRWIKEFNLRERGRDIASHTTPHNDYLLYWAELGLMGVFFLLWIFIAQIKIALRLGGDKGVFLGMVSLAMIITCLFNAGLRDALFGVPFMLLLSIPLAGVKKGFVK